MFLPKIGSRFNFSQKFSKTVTYHSEYVTHGCVPFRYFCIKMEYEVMGVMFTGDRVQMTDEDIVNVYKESYK